MEKGRGEFQEYLRTQITRLNPAVVAEESTEELMKQMGTESTAKAVAEECGIKHLYCDPDSKTRTTLGIPIGSEHLSKEEKQKYHNIREMHWYQQIRPFSGKPVLFVCGAEHIPSFRTLLSGNECQVETLCEYWRNDMYGT